MALGPGKGLAGRAWVFRMGIRAQNADQTQATGCILAAAESQKEIPDEDKAKAGT